MTHPDELIMAQQLPQGFCQNTRHLDFFWWFVNYLNVAGEMFSNSACSTLYGMLIGKQWHLTLISS